MEFTKHSIRPVLNLQPALTHSEIFQNKVLRPILKLQNDELVVVFKSYCARQKIVINATNRDKLAVEVTQVLKNTGFRNLLLGVVLGMLTTAELETYFSNELEFRKRIVTMLKQRLTDNLCK